MSKNKKKAQLKVLDEHQYEIYGIFNFKTKRLVYVSMDEDAVELEFDLSDYDTDEYDIVAFKVLLA